MSTVSLLQLNVSTPEEASRKWCPFVRNLFYTSTAQVKGEGKNDVAASYNADRTHNKCISGNCALWVVVADGRGCCGASAAAHIISNLAL
jgi:hypothetical protein